MGSDWPKVPIGEVAEVFDGPHATPHLTEEGPIFLGISSLRDGRIVDEGTAHLSERDFDKWTRRVTPRFGDVVFSYETRLGEAARIPEGLRCCLGRRMGLIRPKPDVLDDRFLLYYYLGPEFQSLIRERTVRGSTVERIALKEFPGFPVRWPPLGEQRRIASILGALDDKIELNRRMSRTLELIARACFKSRFVDFRGAPAERVESELGPIPPGWSVVNLGDVASVIDCLHSRKPDRQELGQPLLQLNNIRDDGLLDMTDTYSIDAGDYTKWTSRIEVREGDCAITNVGRSGAVAQVPAGFRAAMGRNMTAIRLGSSFPYPSFLVELLLSDVMKVEVARRLDSGTILDSLNVRSIPRLRFLMPPRGVLDEFESVVGPIRGRMELLLQESRLLSQTRDVLLPRLLSGELTIPV